MFIYNFCIYEKSGLNTKTTTTTKQRRKKKRKKKNTKRNMAANLPELYKNNSGPAGDRRHAAPEPTS